MVVSHGAVLQFSHLVPPSGGVHVGTGKYDPTSDAGDTTAGASPTANLSVSLLRLRGQYSIGADIHGKSRSGVSPHLAASRAMR